VSTWYWTEATEFDFVATKLLLAEKAKIVNLVVAELEARHLIDAVSGQYTYIGGGRFEIGTYDVTTMNGETTYWDNTSYDVGIIGGKAYLRFWEDGEVVGVLNADCFKNQTSVPDSYTPQKYQKSSSKPTSLTSGLLNATGTTYYRFSEGYTIDGNRNKKYRTTNDATPGSDHGSWRTSASITSNNKMPSGWYVECVTHTEIANQDGKAYRRSYRKVVYIDSSAKIDTSTNKSYYVYTEFEDTGMIYISD
jgi:hypothetical protein